MSFWCSAPTNGSLPQNMSPSRASHGGLARTARIRFPTTGAWNETWNPIDANEPSGRNSPVKKSDASVTVGEPETLCNAMRISSVIARRRDLMTSKATGWTSMLSRGLIIDSSRSNADVKVTEFIGDGGSAGWHDDALPRKLDNRRPLEFGIGRRVTCLENSCLQKGGWIVEHNASCSRVGEGRALWARCWRLQEAPG